MENFGEIIRKLRQEKEFPLRKVAAYLDIDQAILSKIERGQRKAPKIIVLKLAEYFQVNENTLLVAWLSDNLYDQLEDEEQAMKALQAAEEKVLYQKKSRLDRETVIQLIHDFLKNDGRVSKAWVFGSFARGEDRYNSDIDVIVKYSDKATGTLFDYADIKFKLENLLKQKVDLVEEGYVKSFARESINRDKVLIYG
jgi:predicted nucleotidyltransferase